MNNQYADPYNSYQDVPVGSDELYAQQLQEDKVKNIISQISPENQIYEIQMRIKGYFRTANGEWKKIDDKAPEPHPLLINRYIAYLSSIMNQNTTLSNLSQLQIANIMKQIIEYVSDDLDSNAEEYRLQRDFTERTRIGHIMLNSTFLVLNRSLNGQEARRFWSTLNLTESSQGGGQPGVKQGGEWWKFWK